jgi:hypothetical protein
MRIEVPRRFVGYQQRRPMHQGTGDRRALLFSTAQLVKKMAGAFPQADQIDQLGGALLAFPRRNPLQEQRKGNVLQHIHRRQKVEELKDEPHLPPPKLGEGVVVGSMQGEPINENLSGSRMIETTQQMD